MQEREWFPAILASILAAGIAAAQGTETNSAVPSTAPTSLPGEGLAQHPFLYCGEWQQRGKSEQMMYLVREGKVVWSYSIPSTEELGDCTLLSDGNILFSRRLGASEVAPDKKIVWNYDAPPNTEIHTAYPMGKDRVLLMQNGNPAKLWSSISREAGERTDPSKHPWAVPAHSYHPLRNFSRSALGYGKSG